MNYAGSRKLTQDITSAINGNNQAKEVILEHYEPKINEIVNETLQKYNLGESVREDLLQTCRLSILQLLDTCKKNNKNSTYFARNLVRFINAQLLREICHNRGISVKSSHLEAEKDLMNMLEQTETIPLEDQCTACEISDKYDYIGTLKMLDSIRGSNTCPEVAYQVLYYRYIDQLTLRETGDRLNISYETVRQIEQKALERINNYLMSTSQFVLDGTNESDEIEEILKNDSNITITDLKRFEVFGCRYDINNLITKYNQYPLTYGLDKLKFFCVIPFIENQKYAGLFIDTAPSNPFKDDSKILGYWQINNMYEVYLLQNDIKTVVDTFNDETDAINKVLAIMYTDKD